MRMGNLLTKWTLMGVLKHSNTLNVIVSPGDSEMYIRTAYVKKGGIVANVIYRETRFTTSQKQSVYQLINADLESEHFNAGVYIKHATLKQLDEHF